MTPNHRQSSPLLADAVLSQLNRILGSESFVRSERMIRFLQFIVRQTLEGNDKGLSEYAIGLRVFDRGEAFDPRIDSIVRVDARRLRSKLDEYYHAGGADDPIVIDLPKGTYVPRFRGADGAVAAAQAGETARATARRASQAESSRSCEVSEGEAAEGSKKRPSPSRPAARWAIASAILVSVFALFWVPQPALEPTVEGAVESPRVAVLPFDNLLAVKAMKPTPMA